MAYRHLGGFPALRAVGLNREGSIATLVPKRYRRESNHSIGNRPPVLSGKREPRLRRNQLLPPHCQPLWLGPFLRCSGRYSNGRLWRQDEPRRQVEEFHDGGEPVCALTPLVGWPSTWDGLTPAPHGARASGRNQFPITWWLS